MNNQNKKLSIIIPVFNEEKTISLVLNTVLQQNTPGWQKEIIVVNDGSKDNSKDIIEKFLPNIKIVEHQTNYGKGSAINSGLKLASGELIIIQDADLEYNPADWNIMLQEFEQNPQVSAIYGSRNLVKNRGGYFYYIWGVNFINWLINLLFKSQITDSYTCYKLIRSEVFKNLNIKSTGFELEAEITCKILKAKGIIKEVPISYKPRTFLEGKHIRAKDGLIGIRTIIWCWLGDF